MTDAEKMREAAAQAVRDALVGDPRHDAARHIAVAAIRALPIPDAKPWTYRETTIARLMNDPQVQEILRKPPVDASAPAADCQKAGLVTGGAPQITIRHGWTNDPYPEGWTLCVADNSVTYKRGGNMDIYTIEKGFLAFAAAQIVNPTAMQTVPTFTSANASYVPAGLLDEVKAARRLYLDLDGVMADFDAHFPDVFGVDHKSMADDDMWAKINAHPSYFEDMPLCVGAADFFGEISRLEPIILTACPRTNYAHVASQKRRWVRKHLGDLTVLPVMGGHNKHLFMHAPGDVLIDDYEKNCAPWRKSGGVAILHTSFDETRAALARLEREVG